MCRCQSAVSRVTTSRHFYSLLPAMSTLSAELPAPSKRQHGRYCCVRLTACSLARRETQISYGRSKVSTYITKHMHPGKRETRVSSKPAFCSQESSSPKITARLYRWNQPQAQKTPNHDEPRSASNSTSDSSGRHHHRERLPTSNPVILSQQQQKTRFRRRSTHPLRHERNRLQVSTAEPPLLFLSIFASGSRVTLVLGTHSRELWMGCAAVRSDAAGLRDPSDRLTQAM